MKSSGYYIALAQTNDGSGVSIADGFIQSGEFQHLYGTLTDGNFIIQMYQNVGRAPDNAGYNFWLSQMETNHTTQAMVRLLHLPKAQKTLPDRSELAYLGLSAN